MNFITENYFRTNIAINKREIVVQQTTQLVRTNQNIISSKLKLNLNLVEP
jgi:hypothetical protein